MQGSVSSGTTPYTLGFRNTLKITNGNQTSGAGASDYAYIDMALEGQDIVGSGWNYNSASSFITFSFWIKSSVAQSFKGYFTTEDGTSYQYPYDTGSLSADTWTKVTKTIPGNSNLTINNDNGRAFSFSIWPYIGTNFTASSVTEDAWSTFASAARTKDATSTWWTTNDATLEITGVQLEVGSVATDFEHRSFAQELALCQRYYYKISGADDRTVGSMHQNGAYGVCCTLHHPQKMRATPTATAQTVTDAYSFYNKGTVNRHNTMTGVFNDTFGELHSTGFSADDGVAGLLRITNTSAYIDISAEL